MSMRSYILSFNIGNLFCLGFSTTNTKWHGNIWCLCWSHRLRLVTVIQICNWLWSEDPKRQRFTSIRRCSIWSYHFCGQKNWSSVKCQRCSKPHGITGSSKKSTVQSLDLKTYLRVLLINLRSSWLIFSSLCRRNYKILTTFSLMIAFAIREWAMPCNS